MGAYFLLISPPAENSAMSMALLSKDCSFNSSTIYSLSLNLIFSPADLLDAKKYILSTGNCLSSRILIKVVPTIPVAPTIARFTFFMGYHLQVFIVG